MGSHALTPPLALPSVSWTGMRIALAICVIAALGAAGLVLALTLPAGHPTAPAHFQGQIQAL